MKQDIKDKKEKDKEDDEDSDEDSDEDGDEDEVNVIKFEYNETTYYRDDDGVVYKNMEGDEVGEWDDETKEIKFSDE